jgi:hypothetical protein
MAVNYLYLYLLYSKFCFQGDDNEPMIHLQIGLESHLRTLVHSMFQFLR